MMPPCTQCARPLAPSRSGPIPEGYARHKAFGLCRNCYERGYRRVHPQKPRVRRSTRPPFHAVSVDYRLSNGQVITLPSERVDLRMAGVPDDGIVDPVAVWRGWKDWTAPRLTARELLCVFAELATRGWGYVQIAERFNATNDGVRMAMQRHGLPLPSATYGEEYMCRLITQPGRRQGASPDALRQAGVMVA
jgi:hypothetical protein